ncbi:class II glutamine amidotransferase [Necator americanus]|uniref:glutamine--fructose-6-phosphate transaminase (isomerizing) n=1 Tax=Necator americanus TaxID=51031 RepID=W2TQ96_NECAM|nr:class II glutamine amidotransferase [Necator americanus]ETN83834.1 class II glutamine amidotransferase [Necator americanus]
MCGCGIAIDGGNEPDAPHNEVLLLKKVGKVSVLEESIKGECIITKGHGPSYSKRSQSETDTEVIAKLIQHIHDRYPDFSFRQLVEVVVQQLEGAFALAFKSPKFPGQLVATRRGSPLLLDDLPQLKQLIFANNPRKNHSLKLPMR